MKRFCRFMGMTLAAAGLAVSVWSFQAAVKPPVPHFQTSDRCSACHNGLSTSSGEDISIGLAWQPTMMANSARDPYWQASVRRETIDHPESSVAIEDECSICHMPMARFEAKAAGHEGAVFSHLGFLQGNRGDELAADGVSCAVCHQIGKEKLGTRASFVGNFVIGGPNVQGDRLVYGPFVPDAGHIRVMRTSTGGFIPAESAHIRESELCATCHTLITMPIGPGGKAVGSEFPEQVPYQEWLHSEYRQKRSCQSCHMPAISEKVVITSIQGVPRTGVTRHVFLGGNFFISGILNRNRNELSVKADPGEFENGIRRTREHLQSEAAKISVGKIEVRDGRLETEIVVENSGGHKLPTAYPSRRAWLHVIVKDKNSRTVFESGAINSNGAISGNDNDADAAKFEPHYSELRDSGQVQIYEAIMADSRGSVTTGLLHAIRYAKDNRLLPRGFDKKTADANIAVAGPALDDADFSGGGDRVRYSIDPGAAQGPFRIEAELCYQPVGYRWAINLKNYGAEEPQRFSKHYETAAASSMHVLARAHAEQ